MKFFGIDPSFSETGMAVIDEDGYHDVIVHNTVNKNHKDGPTIPHEERILSIENRMMEFLMESGLSKGDVICIEGLATSRVSTSTHMLAGLHYCLRTKLFHNGFSAVIVPPSTLKKFVLGKANKKGTKKAQMLLYIYKRWGIEFTNDNMADAYALAQYGRYQNGYGEKDE